MVCQHNIQDVDHDDVDGVDHEVDHDEVGLDDVDHDDVYDVDALQPGGQAPSGDGLERQVLSSAPW